MKINYDPVADAMYIHLSKGKKSSRTVEAGESIILDYSGKTLIGIEILDASHILSDKDLDQFTLSIKGKLPQAT